MARHARRRPALPAAVALSALLAGVGLAAVPRAIAPRAAVPAPASAPRESGSATATTSRGPAGLASPIVSTSDTFLVSGFGFEDPGGECRTRGWVGEDRAGRVYVHPSPSLVVNQSFFTGHAPAPFGVENLTGRLSSTRLVSPLAVATNDSGAVIFSDGGNGVRLFAGYPATGVVRVYGTYPDLDGAHRPVSAAFDPVHHNVVASDELGGKLLRFSGNGGAGAVIAGFGSIAEDTVVALASVGTPTEVAVGPGGDIFFADPSTHRVRKLTPAGRIVTVIGTGVAGSASDGTGEGTQLSGPSGLALDPAGTGLYVSDTGNGRILHFDLGAPQVPLVSDIAVSAPGSMAFSPGDPGAVLFSSGNQVFRLEIDSIHPTLAAGGDGYGPPAGSALGTQQELVTPTGLTPDGSGGLYFADPRVRLVLHLTAGGQIAVVAGVPAGMAMGERSLWFGLDAESDPAEASSWVQSSGYGNRWSQRVISPEFSLVSHPAAELSFDAALDLGDAQTVGPVTGGECMLVQALTADGGWASLNVRLLGAGVQAFPVRAFAGRGIVHVTAALGADGNNLLGLATATRLRLVLQTSESESNEDGQTANTRGAAVVDNLRVDDPLGSVIPVVDFEDGLTGEWSLAALNGAIFEPECLESAAAIGADAPGQLLAGCDPYVRDVAAPLTTVELRSGFDAQDPSCAWTFLSPGDSLASGTMARLTSPWFATSAGDERLLISFSGKLNTRDQARFLRVMVRGKNAGDTRPRFVSSVQALLDSGTDGGDAASPYVDQRVLSYPAEFESAPAAESLQVVFQIEDRGEEATAAHSLDGRPRTRLPYLDDIRFFQIGVDSDHDGVPDDRDACPTECAAGQDGNRDGCVDATATLRHVESWAREDLPLHYAISAGADPANPSGEDATEIETGFAAWTAAPNCTLLVQRDPDTPQVEASALDGVNLVTFADPDFQFPPGVLAVTPTLSFTRRSTFFDRVVLPGQIVDADMIFNPASHFRTPSFAPPGSFDLRSVTVHEAGHFYGLSHSGVLRATMFFVLQNGTGGTTLEDDDLAAIGAAYPGPGFTSGLGTIEGTVTRGSDGEPIPGALVSAAPLDGGGAPMDTVSSDYTDENGRYHLRGLAAGSYAVRLTPLDGEVGGFPLTPEFISERVATGAQTNFAAEWRSSPETASDEPDVIGPVAVAAGAVSEGVDIVSNVDTTPPQVTGVTPDDNASAVRIDPTVLVALSERIDPATLNDAFRLHIEGSTSKLGGAVLLVNGGRTIIFNPTLPLLVDTPYVLDITSALTDREGVPLSPPFSSRFRTIAATSLAIADVEPRAAAEGAFITILGGGFDPAGSNSVVFAGADGPAPASHVTPSSMVVAVPAGATTGNLHVIVNEAASNTSPFTVLAAAPQVSPSRVADVALSFAPTDVAVAPGGGTAFAVGSGGLAIVDLATRTASYRAIGAASHVALTPDGRHALLTQPSLGQVLDIGADPGDLGSFGIIQATIPIGDPDSPGLPDGITVAPSGRRAFVTDQSAGLLYAIDTDPTSATRDQVVDELGDPDVLLTAGVAVLPTGDQVLYTSGNQGSRARVLGGDAASLYHPGESSGGVAVTPQATEALYAGTGASGGELLSVLLDAGAPDATSQIAVGGDLRDVIIAPQKQSALVVNSANSMLQVVGVDPSDDGSYHQVVAEARTGSSPVALAQSLDGSVIVVANFGSRSLSIFRTGGTALLRSLPGVARPGDRVAVQAATGLFGAGSQVDLGDGPFAVAYRTPSGEGAAFVVPPGPQRQAALAGVDPLGTRTLSLPFRVVDPIGTLSPQATGVQLGLVPLSCGPYTIGAFDALRVSPDGGLLALVRSPTCSGPLELFAADAERPKEFGQTLTRANIVPGEESLQDLAFTTDGRRLWAVVRNRDLRIADSDRSSPTFGSVLSTIGVPVLSAPGGIAADPLGRYMCVGDIELLHVAFFTPTGEPTGQVPTQAPIEALAASPDGRVLVGAGRGRAEFVDLESLSEIGASAVHGSATVGSQQQAVAIPTSGRRAVVRFTTGIGIYDLEAGSVGTELYFGNPFAPGVSPGQLLPGPGGEDVLAACAACDTVLRIDASVIPPAITYVPIGQRVTRLAASPDGRQLWLGRSDGVASGDVKLASLSPATALSLLSGGGQSGLPGSTLPIAVRVRVTGGIGASEAGVVVRFALAGGGTLDQDSSTVYHVTDANGEAGVSWTLSGAAGTEHLAITALGVPGGTLDVSAEVVGDDSQIVPAVVEFGPASGTPGLNVGSPVYIRFNQKMAEASITTKMELFANQGAVAGAFSLLEGGKFVLFQPTQPLPFAAPCSLSVAAGALDLDGQALPASRFATFITHAAPPLAVTSLSPPSGPVGALVVMSGTGFSAIPSQNTTLFNGVPTVVTAAFPTSITAPVPPGAATGPVTVQVGSSVSPGVNFTVLAKSAPLSQVGGELPAGPSPTRLAITSDGSRAYVTNPASNTVTALDLHTLQTLAIITVGLQPSGIDLLPDDSRAYVCNQGSDDVSVIDIDPSSPTYHTVVATIPVGHQPSDLGVSPLGPVVIVVNFGSSSLSVIDANPGNATFDQVTTSTNTGSGGKGIGITPDGGRAYIVTSGGTVEKFDLMTGAVTTSTNTGSSGGRGGGIIISPDGTLALVLLDNGTIIGIDIVPGSSRENQVTTSTNTGSGGGRGGGIIISPDGGSAYVTDTDGNVVFAFQIVISSGSPLSQVPGPAVQLVPAGTIEVGQAPVGLAFDPLGGSLFVANSGSGTLTIIGRLVGPPTVEVEFDFNPNTLNLNSLGKWVTGRIEPPAPFTPADIVVASLRLNGSVAVDPAAPVVIGDGDNDGKPDLTVSFPRSQIELLLPEGDAVPVTVTGTIGASALSGTDVIRVRRGKVTHPAAGAVLPPGQATAVRWTTPQGVHVQWVAVLHSVDHGVTWTLDASQLPNTGEYQWTVPAQPSDSVRVAVALVEGGDPEAAVSAVLSVSDYFRIGGTVAVEAAPAALSFAPIRPNPAGARAVLRFGLPRAALVRLEIYDLQGRCVRTLVHGEQPAGWHELTWSGRLDGGEAEAGIYFLRFRAEGREFRQRLVWLH